METEKKLGPRLIGRGFNFYRDSDYSVEIDKKIVFIYDTICAEN